MKRNLLNLCLLSLLFFSTNFSGHAQEVTNDLKQYTKTTWEFTSGGPIHGSAVISDNILYFGSSDNFVYAVDINTGKEIWKFQTKEAILSTPNVKGEKLFINSMDGALYSLHKKTGKQIWKFQAAQDKQKDIWDYHTCNPVISENTIYFGDGEGIFYAVNIETGEEIWHYKTKDIIHSSPVILGGKVYFGSFDGYFYALDKTDGSEIWKFNTIGQRYFPKGAVQQGAAVYENTLYFGSRDFNIYALNAETGNGMWNMYERGSWVIATPTVKDTLLLFGTSDSHHFYAMDARSGKIIWKKKINLNVFGPCSVGENLAYFGSLNGKIYAANLNNGETVWEFQTEDSKKNWNQVFDKENKISKSFIENYGSDAFKAYEVIHSLGSFVSTPLLHQGKLYVTSMNGKVYAIE